jgi:hypothetical protein
MTTIEQVAAGYAGAEIINGAVMVAGRPVPAREFYECGFEVPAAHAAAIAAFKAAGRAAAEAYVAAAIAADKTRVIRVRDWHDEVD